MPGAVLDIEQALLLLELEPPFEQARRAAGAPAHGQGLAPRHRAARASSSSTSATSRRSTRRPTSSSRSPRARAAAASRATPSRSAPRPRAARAEEAGRRAYEEEQRAARRRRRPRASTTRSARACPTTRSCTATRAASPTPSGASGRSPASTSPARGDDVQQWARVKFSRRRAHRAGRLAAVRRLLQARPGRRARAALHDRRPARDGRGRLRARRAAARLRARRRAAQPVRAAADDARLLAGRQPHGGGPRRARLGARRRRAPGAAPLRRADLRGHGRDRPRRRGRRARRGARARPTRTRGSGSAACACGSWTAPAAIEALERARRLGPSGRGAARPRARPPPRRRPRRRRSPRPSRRRCSTADVGARLVAPRPRARADRPRQRRDRRRRARAAPRPPTPRSRTCSSACARPSRACCPPRDRLADGRAPRGPGAILRAGSGRVGGPATGPTTPRPRPAATTCGSSCRAAERAEGLADLPAVEVVQVRSAGVDWVRDRVPPERPCAARAAPATPPWPSGSSPR